VVQSLITSEKFTVAGGNLKFTLPAWNGIWIG